MTIKKKTPLVKATANSGGPTPALVSDLRRLILDARAQMDRAVDSGLVWLYWSIGNRVRTDVLKEKRAEYGKEIVSAVGRQLAAEFGSGFSDKNLRHMIRFAEVFPDPKMLQSLTALLSWTPFKSIIYLDNPLKRDQTSRKPDPGTPDPGKPDPGTPTRQQGQFLAFIREYIAHNHDGVAPTHAAFQKFFNLTAPSVNSMLVRLEDRGFIKRIPGQARAIKLAINPALIPPLERPFKF